MRSQVAINASRHKTASGDGARAWVAFAVCAVLFLVAACVNHGFGMKLHPEPVESTLMCALLFLIPLIAQGVGLSRLWAQHENRCRTFFWFYVVTMCASLFTFTGCWLVYGIVSDSSQRFAWITLGLIGLLTALSLIMTWAIIRQRAQEDRDNRNETNRVPAERGRVSSWLAELSNTVATEKPVALLFFFTVFLSVSYLFAFTFAFHDRSQGAGRRALFMKNVDRSTESSTSFGHKKVSVLASTDKETFKIDDLSFVCLKLRGLSNQACEKLESIKGDERLIEKDFVALIQNSLNGAKMTPELTAALLEEARPRSRFLFQFDSDKANLAFEDASEIWIPSGAYKDEREHLKAQRIDNYRMMRAIISQVATLLRENRQVKIAITGHADENPTGGSAYQSNYELAEARAQNVQIAITKELTADSVKRDSGVPWQQIQWRCASSSNETETPSLTDEMEMIVQKDKVKGKNRAKAKAPIPTNDKGEKRYKEPIGRFVRVDVEAFDDPVSDFKPMTLIDYVYFANYTITTTGYGDIIPSTAFAKFVCSLANIFEVFFLVVFLSAVLSVKARGNGERRPEGQDSPVGAGAAEE